MYRETNGGYKMTHLDMTRGQYELTPAPVLTEDQSRAIDKDHAKYLAYLAMVEAENA